MSQSNGVWMMLFKQKKDKEIERKKKLGLSLLKVLRDDEIAGEVADALLVRN